MCSRIRIDDGETTSHFITPFRIHLLQGFGQAFRLFFCGIKKGSFEGRVEYYRKIQAINWAAGNASSLRRFQDDVTRGVRCSSSIKSARTMAVAASTITGVLRAMQVSCRPLISKSVICPVFMLIVSCF